MHADSLVSGLPRPVVGVRPDLHTAGLDVLLFDVGLLTDCLADLLPTLDQWIPFEFGGFFLGNVTRFLLVSTKDPF